MRLSGQFQFFLRNAKQPISSLLGVFMHEKFLPLLFFSHLVLFCWLVLVWFVFCAPKFFRKKYTLAWNCPDNLVYYNTDLYPYQHAYGEFICTHLFFFVIICENLFFLWEYFWILLIYKNLFLFMIICENLFFYLPVKIS